MPQEQTNCLLKKYPLNATKVYKRRWIILLIFILYSAANSFQWMEYSIMANIIQKYYKVTSSAVDWTSIIYMAVYPIIFLPVSYIIHVKGLRVAALIGGIGTFLAAAVKVFSLRRHLFYVVLIGQALGSTAQVFILCLPAKIAAVWFKPSEASTACSLAVFGTQLGFALGFILPTTIVRNNSLILMIESNLRYLCWGLTIYMIPVVTAIIFFFPRLPPLPPSTTQVDERKKKSLSFTEFLDMFIKLMKQKEFVLHTIAYGINVGVFAAIGTLLNQFVTYYFPNRADDAGRMGLVSIVSGMVGSILFGLFLDKTHRYKETTLFIYYMSAISVAAFMVALKFKVKILAYCTVALVGFFTQSYMPVGFELAVELTFPSEESTTTGILNATTQGLGVIITIILGEIYQRFGPFWALSSQVVLLLIGSILTQILPNNIKRRQEALLKNKEDMVALKIVA